MTTGGVGDPLKDVIESLVSVMHVDFGKRFAEPYADPEQLRQLKRRLYKVLRAFAPCDILDGYELLVEKKPNYLPTVPEIADAVLASQRLRSLAARDQAMIEQAAALPPPSLNADPKRVLAAQREALGKMDTRETPVERAQRLERLKAAQARHEALLEQAFPLQKRPMMTLNPHKCAVAYCSNAGVLAHGVSGKGSLFCAEHFMRKA